MYKYHGNSEHQRRLVAQTCRCQSDGIAYDLVDLINEGRIADPRQPEQLLSTPEVRKNKNEPHPDGSGYGKTYIYAVSESFDVRIAPDSDRQPPNAVKHETLFHNADVVAAGEIYVKDGVVTGLNDLSGSYNTDGKIETDPAFAAAVLRAFDMHQVPVVDALRTQLSNFSRS